MATVKTCRKAAESARKKVRAFVKAEKSLQACERRVLGRPRRRGDIADMMATGTKCSKHMTAANKIFNSFDVASVKAGRVCKDSTATKNLYAEIYKTEKKLGVKR